MLPNLLGDVAMVLLVAGCGAADGPPDTHAEGDACDSASWELADNLCMDDFTVLTCDANVLSRRSCRDLCQTSSMMDGRCAPSTDGGGACYCTEETCDGDPDHCSSRDLVVRCIDGLSIWLDCAKVCLARGHPYGECDVHSQTCLCAR